MYTLHTPTVPPKHKETYMYFAAKIMKDFLTCIVPILPQKIKMETGTVGKLTCGKLKTTCIDKLNETCACKFYKQDEGGYGQKCEQRCNR